MCLSVVAALRVGKGHEGTRPRGRGVITWRGVDDNTCQTQGEGEGKGSGRGRGRGMGMGYGTVSGRYSCKEWADSEEPSNQTDLG